MDYGYVKKVETDFDGTVAAVKAALKEQGFGVLTEIDIRETLRNRLDVEFRPYKILGACNPVLANRALRAEPDIGLLLPCNVVVQESGDGVTISIADPKAMFTVVSNPLLDEVVQEADRRLRRVLESVP